MSSTKKRLSLLAVAGSVVAIVAVAAAPPTLPSAGANIVGTWRLAVSTPVPGEEDFFDLVVFDKRNTVTDRVSFSSGNTMGIGVWERIAGHDTYAVTLEAFDDADLDGTFDARLQVRFTLQVDGDTLSGTATVDVFTVDGNTLLVSIPGFILEGTRMTVIPE